MDLEKLKQRRDELLQDNEWMDNLIKEKEDELWEIKVRGIAASELARSAMQSALRTAGVVDTFYGPYKPNLEEQKGELNGTREDDFPS